jgi:hypothetical protein
MKKRYLCLLSCITLAFTAQAQAPINDDPCGAIAIPVSAPQDLVSNIPCTPLTQYTNATATNSTGYAAPTCGTSTPSFDSWYKCVVPASGNLAINTLVVNGDPIMQVFSASACSAAPSSFVALGCDDDAGEGLAPYLVLQGLVPGTTVYVRIFFFPSDVSQRQYKICVSDFNAVPALDNITKVGIGTQTPLATLEVNGKSIFRDTAIFSKAIDARGGIKPSATKTYVYSVSPSAFTARRGISTNFVYKDLGNGGVDMVGDGFGVTAPINLPNGAVITKITAYFYDISSTQDLNVNFSVQLSGGGFISLLPVISSTGSSGGQSVPYTLPTPLIIDNISYSYSILCFPSTGNWTNGDINLRNIKIEYRLTEL